MLGVQDREPNRSSSHHAPPDSIIHNYGNDANTQSNSHRLPGGLFRAREVNLGWFKSGVSRVETDHGYNMNAHLRDRFACDETLHFFIPYTEPMQGYLDLDQATGRLVFTAAGRATDVFGTKPSPAMMAILREKIRGNAKLPQLARHTEKAAGFGTDQSLPRAMMSGTCEPFMALDEKRPSPENIHGHLDSALSVHTGITFPCPLTPSGKGHRDGLTSRPLVRSARRRNGPMDRNVIPETLRQDQVVGRVELESDDQEGPQNPPSFARISQAEGRTDL